MNPPPPFQSIPPLLGSPPTLLANRSFQVFFINRNGTVKLSYYNIIDKTTFHQMYFAIQNILIYFQSTTNIFYWNFTNYFFLRYLIYVKSWTLQSVYFLSSKETIVTTNVVIWVILSWVKNWSNSIFDISTRVTENYVY